ncbi:MAG: alpha-ketoglutarate-dependent dioxygenase AlkB [Pseudomonadales bacterium]
MLTQTSVSAETRVLPAPRLYSGLLDADACDEHFRTLRAALHWRSETFRLFGREVLVPRLIAEAGDKGVVYTYSGHAHTACGWIAGTASLCDRVAALTGIQPNHVLANLYRSGRDYMGWHRDDEKGVIGPVAILSLGSTRDLRWRRTARGASERLELEAGSLLVLDGRLHHCLPRRKSCTGERLSLSFRRLEHPSGQTAQIRPDTWRGARRSG